MGTVDSFLDYLNDNDKHLCFTGQADKKEICFLVHLCSGGTSINRNLYRKPLSVNALLMTKAEHPQPTIKGIPVAQFFRICHIYSDQQTFED